MQESSRIKDEIRILGVDDSPFTKNKNQRQNCLVIGTIFRGGNYMDGLISFNVTVEGNDSTKKLISAIKKTRHYNQLNCIMLNGISLAVFNVLDIRKISSETSLPVIVVIRKLPDLRKIEKTLTQLKFTGRVNIIKKAGRIYPVKVHKRNLFIQVAGISLEKAAQIVRLTAVHSIIPEPIRIAHIIASGIVKGE